MTKLLYVALVRLYKKIGRPYIRTGPELKIGTYIVTNADVMNLYKNSRAGSIKVGSVCSR